MRLSVPHVFDIVLRARPIPVLGHLAYYTVRVAGAEVPRSVRPGRRFRLMHGGSGVVIHPNTTIGNNVTVFQGVTLGRADIYRSNESTPFEGIVLEDNVTVCAGAKVLCSSGVLRLSRGTIVGANAVLTHSTRPGEIWVGIPARLIRTREEYSEGPSRAVRGDCSE
jgi:serine O-acetyltransferase